MHHFGIPQEYCVDESMNFILMSKYFLGILIQNCIVEVLLPRPYNKAIVKAHASYRSCHTLLIHHKLTQLDGGDVCCHLVFWLALLLFLCLKNCHRSNLVRGEK